MPDLRFFNLPCRNSVLRKQILLCGPCPRIFETVSCGLLCTAQSPSSSSPVLGLWRAFPHPNLSFRNL